MACCNDRCECVAIQALRIFDGARLQQRIERTLTLTDFNPATVIPPFTYISAEYDGDAVITSQTVSAFGTGNRSRVSLIYNFPVTVAFTDANGVRGTAQGVITDGVDVVLTLPTTRPYFFEVEVSFRSRIGEISGETANIRGCLLTIVKVLTKTDMIVKGCRLTYPLSNNLDDIVCRALFNQQ